MPNRANPTPTTTPAAQRSDETEQQTQRAAEPTQISRAARGGVRGRPSPYSPADILAMQRTVGNRATVRLLHTDLPNPKATLPNRHGGNQLNTALQRYTAPEFDPENYEFANDITVAGNAGEASALDNWLRANEHLVGVTRNQINPGAGGIVILVRDRLRWNNEALRGAYTYRETLRKLAAYVLHEQLAGAGLPTELAEPDQTQTHHIVEFGARHADISRQILDWVNIDINSAVNGVHLPSCERDDGGNASIHHGSHTDEYAMIVMDRLIDAVNINRQTYRRLNRGTIEAYLGAAISRPRDRTAIVEALNQLRLDLLAGNIRLNKNTDMEIEM